MYANGHDNDTHMLLHTLSKHHIRACTGLLREYKNPLYSPSVQALGRSSEDAHSKQYKTCFYHNRVPEWFVLLLLNKYVPMGVDMSSLCYCGLSPTCVIFFVPSEQMWGTIYTQKLKKKDYIILKFGKCCKVETQKICVTTSLKMHCLSSCRTLVHTIEYVSQYSVSSKYTRFDILQPWTILLNQNKKKNLKAIKNSKIVSYNN